MLLAGDPGPWRDALGGAARASGWRVLLAEPGAAEGSPSSAEGNSADAVLPWNPASYVSAGALSLAASSEAGIEALILLSAPEKGERSLFDGPPGSLGAAVEARALGPLWLARETIRRFETRKTGKMLLVSVEPGSAEGTASGEEAWPAFVGGAFRGFGEALFDRGRGAPWQAWGVIDRGGKPEALAAFALALLEEGKSSKAGRWLPFSGKGGLFGIF